MTQNKSFPPVRKLSDTRRRILRCLADWDKPCLPTAKEIAQACGEHNRASDWGAGALREMSFAWPRALVTPAGYQSQIRARSWRITEAGIDALAQAEKASAPA